MVPRRRTNGPIQHYQRVPLHSGLSLAAVILSVVSGRRTDQISSSEWHFDKVGRYRPAHYQVMNLLRCWKCPDLWPTVSALLTNVKMAISAWMINEAVRIYWVHTEKQCNSLLPNKMLEAIQNIPISNNIYGTMQSSATKNKIYETIQISAIKQRSHKSLRRYIDNAVKTERVNSYCSFSGQYLVELFVARNSQQKFDLTIN